MGRRLERLAGGLALLVLAAAGLYALARALGPAPEERRALALLEAPVPPPQGRDGFAALYTGRHDVPESRQVPLLAEDLRRYAAAGADASGMPRWRSALDEWPLLEDAREGDPPWCAPQAADCLERVRARPAAYADLLERNTGLLRRAEALRGYDHFRNPFPPHLDLPLPGFQGLARLATRTAWRFAAGQVDLALADACADLALGRRLLEGGDSLAGSVMGGTLVEGNATLLAQMLAELPADHPLPAACARAVALPLALEEGVCRAMLAEGRMVLGTLRAATAEHGGVGSGPAGWAGRLLFDPGLTAARIAPRFAWYCGAQARARLARDLPLDGPPPPPRRPLRCLANLVGCRAADVAVPAHAGYARRLQDAAAQLRAVAALLWLRGQGTVEPVLLERLPAAMRSPARPLRLDPRAGTLGTARYWQRSPEAADSWTVPLPASRLQPAAPRGRRSGLRRT